MGAVYEHESTFDLIRATASTLLSQAGYKGMGMRLLADAVGIKVGSLYNHIESKKALLYELISEYEMHLLHVFKSRNLTKCKSAVQMNALLWEKVSEYVAQNCDLARLARNELQHLSLAQVEAVSDIRLRRKRQFQALLAKCAEDVGLSSTGLEMLSEELHVLLDCHIGLDANVIEDPNGIVRRQLRSMASMLLVRRD
ncbi:TetR/AcrR family transcriptional regulator [Pseudomonas taiwanensis]|uniref:TetR/AcrR family transcriptional regulator n=1 Tax=Pseudomonas taiwanensis TaxID=470150 RepID=UPI0028DF36E1|nr:TetR/AcrR family transcriptional regulator [Pseudomonas taiwanensis]MDT8924506.1 TetR/AcrR family transcriptional regulator [Pseudomonas taiwanensis]